MSLSQALGGRSLHLRQQDVHRFLPSHPKGGLCPRYPTFIPSQPMHHLMALPDFFPMLTSGAKQCTGLTLRRIGDVRVRTVFVRLRTVFVRVMRGMEVERSLPCHNFEKKEIEPGLRIQVWT